MQEESGHRSDGHGDVVRQSVISQSFAASGRRHDVDDYRVSSHRHHSERNAVDDAEQDEQGKQSGHHVAGKDQGEDEIGEQVQRLAGERVQQVARERTDTEGRDGIAAQYHADGGVRYLEFFK